MGRVPTVLPRRAGRPGPVRYSAVRSAHLHPEFGYLCPSPRFRRKAWALLAFLVIGSIAGASGILPMTERDAAPVAGPADDPAGASSQIGQPGVPLPRQAQRPRADSAGGETVVAKSVAANALLARPALRETDAKAESDRPGCEETTWSYLDGRCISGNARRTRIVRVPSSRLTVVPLPPHRSAVASASRDLAARDTKTLEPPKATQATLAVAPAAATDAPPPAVAANELPTPHGQTRRREQAKDAAPRGASNPAAARVPTAAFRQGPFAGFLNFLR
jgi:ribonuclease E